MGRKKRSINRAKFGNYGRSSSYHNHERRNKGEGIDSTDLRELAVENGWLLERQSILKKRRVIGE
jgi:hypothetical protein